MNEAVWRKEADAVIVYNGSNLAGWRVWRNGHLFVASPSQGLRNHSPDGFAWGYRGSGPAQLALALLYDVTGDAEQALAHYQAFKEDVVARFPDQWLVTDTDVLGWLKSRRDCAVASSEKPADKEAQ